jgi:hypothetical protein
MSDRWGDSQRDRDELDAWLTRAQEDGEYGEIESEDVDYLEDVFADDDEDEGYLDDEF